MRLAVVPVAKSFETAPRRKKSRSVSGTFAGGSSADDVLDLIVADRRSRSMFLSCSNRVNWRIGLMTSTSAGPRPWKKAAGPSVRRMWRIVLTKPIFFLCCC